MHVNPEFGGNGPCAANFRWNTAQAERRHPQRPGTALRPGPAAVTGYHRPGGAHQHR